MLGFRHIQMIPLGDFDGRQLSVLDAAIDGRSVARFLFILPHFGVRFRRSLPFISTIWIRLALFSGTQVCTHSFEAVCQYHHVRGRCMDIFFSTAFVSWHRRTTGPGHLRFDSMRHIIYTDAFT